MSQKPTLKKIVFGQNPKKVKPHHKKKSAKPAPKPLLDPTFHREMVEYGMSMGLDESQARYAISVMLKWKELQRRDFRRSCHQLSENIGVRLTTLKEWAACLFKLNHKDYGAFEEWMGFEDRNRMVWSPDDEMPED